MAYSGCSKNSFIASTTGGETIYYLGRSSLALFVRAYYQLWNKCLNVFYEFKGLLDPSTSTTNIKFQKISNAVADLIHT